MTKAELASMVRTVLNEHGEELSLSITSDNVKLNDYINRALPDAVALLSVGGRWINATEHTPTISDGVFVLPEDFLSVIVLKLKNWRIPVTDITEVGTPEYRRAMNEFTAPGVHSPICLRAGGDKVKCLPAGECEMFIYNAMLGENLNGDDKACKAVAYMAAALVCSYFEEDNGKQRLSELAMSFLV